MPPSLPLPFGRLSAAVRRRLEVAEAAAREAVAETHAEQALDLVAILAPRLPFDAAVDRYLEAMGLDGDEGEAVRTRALVLLSEPAMERSLARERPRGWGFDWRYATPAGAVRFVRRRLRRSAEEELWLELASARAEEALVLTHIQHALVFVELLAEEETPPESVGFYLDRLEVPAGRARTAYQRALAQLAEALLPRLAEKGPAPAPAGSSAARRWR